MLFKSDPRTVKPEESKKGMKDYYKAKIEEVSKGFNYHYLIVHSKTPCKTPEHEKTRSPKK